MDRSGEKTIMSDGGKNGSIFRGGLPYAPDVKRIDEAVPMTELTEGAVIQHGRFERILGYKRGSGRYYAVVNSWITGKRNTAGIFIKWEPKTGVRVLGPADILGHAETKTREKLRQTGRAIRIFGWVDRSRLDDTGQKRLDHQLRIAATVRDSIDTAHKQLAVELAPIKSLPKRSITA